MKTFDEIFRSICIEHGATTSVEVARFARVAAIQYAKLACEQQRGLCADEYRDKLPDNPTPETMHKLIYYASKPELK